MRVTGPTVRRRNHAWLQMRSRERRAAQLVQRQQQQDDTSDDGDVSDNESVSSLDSVDSIDSLDSLDSLASSDDGSNTQPTPTLGPVVASAKVRVPLASVSARVRTGRWIKTLPIPRQEGSAGVTLGVDAAVEPEVETESEPDGVESETDGIESDDDNSASEDESTAPPAITTPPPAGVSPPPPAITSEASTSTIRPPPPPPVADNTSSAPPPASSSVTTTSSPTDTSTSSPSDTSRTSTYGTSETRSAISTMAPSGVTSPKSSNSVTSTKTSQEPRLGTMVPVVPSFATSSSSLDELVTSLTKTWPQTSLGSTTSTASATNSAAPSVPVTGATQSEEAQVIPPDRQAEENGMSIGSAPSNQLNSGAVAGIVLGLLAFIGLLAGAAMLWRKRRRDRGLPFFPQNRLRLGDDDNHNDGAHPPSVSGPLPGTIGGHNAAKTNTQIMDDLMKAAYATENGTNDMESAYAPPAVSKLPPQLPPPQHQQQEVSVFMDEKAYVALAGPPTPASPQRKPVMRWLNAVQTPTQPNGPEIPPTPAMPQSATMPSGGGRVLEQPRPAYYGRDTMTTDTTNTSVRWFG